MGVEPSDVCFINAHGTATVQNDSAETASIKLALGQRAREILVSSNKSMLGHCLCSAGAIEAVATVRTIETGVVPPTISYVEPDPECDLDVVPNEAREALMKRDWAAKDVASMVTLIDDPRHKVAPKGTTKLSAEQAKAILDLRLQRLTALGRDEIKEELDKLATEIADYLGILRSRSRIQTIIKNELAAVKKEFATPRRTVIAEATGQVDEEDLITREEMVVTVSHQGYIKRVPLSTYRAQRRGGKGRGGMQVREEDFVSRLFEMEVPEIYNGTVEIKSIAREPGLRTKVAVTARQEGIDPVGCCVGLRGIRIQNIVNEALIFALQADGALKP